jgi:hypothetical protein
LFVGPDVDIPPVLSWELWFKEFRDLLPSTSFVEGTTGIPPGRDAMESDTQ